MSDLRFTHRLTGCAPIPMAKYLKALGVMRLVSEQADPGVQGWWSGDVFYLKSTLDVDGLRNFFCDVYRPTSVLAPWNGGSGFYPKDNQEAIKAIESGDASRFSPYRLTIQICRGVVKSLRLKERPDGVAKEQMLISCRGSLPDDAISWIDAAFVLTSDGPKYPPLLGTGGNDGRLDFTNNFMQRLLDLFDADTGNSTAIARGLWEEAFFPYVTDGLQRNSILGQFDPGAMERPVNPWDYVLMIEGAISFAAAAVKRHETGTKGRLSYPFCVRSAGVGYGSAAAADEESCRAELWLPLWSRSCSYRELEALLSEGRADVSGRAAKNGVDFARAVATLGIDRGIDEFSRYGFHARNGLAYFAVPLGRFKAEPQPQVNLLAEIDDWLDSFRRAALSDNAPSGARRVQRQLESAILDLCKQREARRLQAVLIALGEAEHVLAKSPKWREEAFQRPVPLLSSKWLIEANDGDGTPEFRLAASLASICSKDVGDLRQHLVPIQIKGSSNGSGRRWAEWDESASANCNVVWGQGNLIENLIAVLQRRLVEAVRRGERSGGSLVFPGHSSCYSSLSDIAAFIRGDLDDERIGALVRGLTLIDWVNAAQNNFGSHLPEGSNEPMPEGIFALLKLCHSPCSVRQITVPLIPAIVRLATSGRMDDAALMAVRKLRGSCLSPAVKTACRHGPTGRRIAAALLFPLRWDSIQKLADTVLTPPSLIESN